MRWERGRQLLLSLGAGMILSVGAPLPAAAAPSTTAPPTLTGESLNAGTDEGSSCGYPGSFTFSMAGAATGPYAGTFTETGNGAAEAGPSYALSALTATFTIQSPQGTVTGTKALSQTVFTCYANPNQYLVEGNMTYQATIHTPTGNYLDHGTGVTEVGVNPRGNVLIETFTSSLTQPVLIAPTSKDQCKHGGWRTYPQFKNQGQCVSFVKHKGQQGENQQDQQGQNQGN